MRSNTTREPERLLHGEHVNALWVITCSSRIKTPAVRLFTILNFRAEQISLQNITLGFKACCLEFNKMTRGIWEWRNGERSWTPADRIMTSTRCVCVRNYYSSAFYWIYWFREVVTTLQKVLCLSFLENSLLLRLRTTNYPTNPLKNLLPLGDLFKFQWKSYNERLSWQKGFRVEPFLEGTNC